MTIAEAIATDTARDVWDAKEAKRKWIDSREVVESKIGHWHCLIGRGINHRWPVSLPGDDHVSIWRRKNKTYIYVSQPYALPFSIISAMKNAADAFGLQFSISTWPSWHYPGSVLFVEWTKRERESA